MPDAELAAYDVIIVGAGLSGIGAACHLRRECPGQRLLLLEGRERSGGTWDLFRYPGVRSDSDMHTLGYSFKPWTEAEAIADGPSILRYIRETACEHAIDELIHYRRQVRRADWDSARKCWSLEVDDTETGKSRVYRARFLLMCSGYFSYRHPHQPDFPGRNDFGGTFVHPQFWPQDLDYRDKRVVIIGSGATAMTLVPAMAPSAASVVMLQRSPSYVMSRASRDRLANFLRALLPEKLAYRMTRALNTRLQHWFYRRSRSAPEKVRRTLLNGVTSELGDSADMRDFTPAYNPWEQRLCLLPDGDLFEAMRAGKARIVTADIDCITATGVRLSSGDELQADIIVSATGLELEPVGGIEFSVDDVPFDFSQSWSYRGIMCSGLPNMVSIFGYINASWTLRADIVSQWFCRLLNHMSDQGLAVVTPTPEASAAQMNAQPWIQNFSAGYLQRALHRLPRQGDRDPWLNSQNYFLERTQLREMFFSEEALRYQRASAQAAISTSIEITDR